MLKLKMFDLSIGGTVERFYLMMAGVIVLGSFGQFTLAAIWALILSVSFILGVSIKTEKKKAVEKAEGEIVPMGRGKDLQKAG